MKPITFETLIQDQKERITLNNEILNNIYNTALHFINETNSKEY